jgi:hypothetical protein
MEKKKARVLGEYQGFLQILNDFEGVYRCTQQKELECFPTCCGEHQAGMQSCLTEVEIESTFQKGKYDPGVLVFAELRKATKDPSFLIGDDLDIEQREKGFFYHGQVYANEEGKMRYVMHPSSWRIHDQFDEANDDDMFFMTMYMAHDDKVVDILDSREFKVIDSESAEFNKSRIVGHAQEKEVCKDESELPVGFFPVSSPSHIAEHHYRSRAPKSQSSVFKPIHSRAPQTNKDQTPTNQLDVTLRKGNRNPEEGT